MMMRSQITCLAFLVLLHGMTHVNVASATRASPGRMLLVDYTQCYLDLNKAVAAATTQAGLEFDQCVTKVKTDPTCKTPRNFQFCANALAKCATDYVQLVATKTQEAQVALQACINAQSGR